jgi:hypothetical protein
MNSTDSSDQQDEDIRFSFQIIGLLFTLIPLIVSEILPFCACDPNGVAHAVFLSISRMNTRKIVAK